MSDTARPLTYILSFYQPYKIGAVRRSGKSKAAAVATVT